MNIKDFLEILYYIAFIILTGLIVLYSYKSYKLESEKTYDLLCRFVPVSEAIGDFTFPFAIEVYNAGNLVAKKVKMIIDGNEITTIDFVKPLDSIVFPIGEMGQMICGNRQLTIDKVVVEPDKKVHIKLVVDSLAIEQDISTDILYATRFLNSGSLQGIEDKLGDIARHMTRY